ncbi:aromatic amino acid ammonia-lyase [Natroniella acetigena]|uniref:HAL/PAL/TAL family ammonia-lyase n=1 Tax=Natroniella acetigena TaxID=52004 RepID=UPI00200B5002|nr:aromatic amino acid ammonia-lyase [Natroniella acetigena]MCK8827300.1 aromatic amino acid ammonia-lyase [Natroniella acetigena]
MTKIKKVMLGEEIGIEEFIAVARYEAKVEFTEKYLNRVKKARKLVDKWIDEERVMYGITTGFGALCDEVISKEETEKLQENIILSHSTSVGEAMSKEEARATMLMVLQNAGQGYSGIRLETLDMYRQFLNNDLTPYAPREGSVGYLCPEAHIALSLIGRGKAYIDGELLESKKALKRIGLEPIKLSAKEGLILISGTTAVTALGALALYDIIKAVKTADVIGAMNLEVLKGTVKALDERLMEVRPHSEQRKTADNLRRILDDSEICKEYIDYRLQDALSLRCIPQLHGASKKTLKDALKTIEIEMNSCTDNPIIWAEGEDGEAISGGNPDSSYVGLELDSASMAATMVAKMSERRNNRLIDGNLSEYPWFMVKKPGLNSGLMIPQYTQAGLLNDMKTLCHPATIDNIPTCGNQEDYVAMGYNAAKKAVDVAEKLEYILAIELLSVYQAYQFIDEDLKPSSVSQSVLDEIAKTVPIMEEDMYLYPHIEKIRDLIHLGTIVEFTVEEIGR